MLRVKRQAPPSKLDETANTALPGVKRSRLEELLAQIENVPPGVMPDIPKFLDRRKMRGEP
jgi:hypothetical protein